MIFKVGILGVTGRVGQELTSLLADGFEIEGDRFEFCDGISQTKSLQSIEGVEIRTLEDLPREPVHVWIDFSRPEATLSLLKLIQAPIVIGTTGFSPTELKEIHRYAQQQPVLLTSNTSPGMNLMMSMLEQVGGASRLGYDVLASEIHHRAKKDSPSGTLKTLLDILQQKGFKQIQVQSARLGDEKGTHTISFFSDDEELSLTHRVNHRRVFARGALLAARFIARERAPGIYRFQDMEKQ